MSGELLDEDRVNVPTTQQPLWCGRSSWAQLLILRIPAGILLLLFGGAFGAALFEGARHGFRTFSRFSHARGPSTTYFPTTLETTAWGVLLVSVMLFIFLRPLFDRRRKRFSFTHNGLIIGDGKGAASWRYEDLPRASFGPIAFGYRFGFSRNARDLPDIYLSRAEARRLASILQGTILAVDESAIRHVPSRPTGLLPDERILWQGRRGLASVSMMRRIGLSALAAPVIGYGVVVWQVAGFYSGTIMGLIMALLLSFMAGGITVVAAVVAFSSLLRDYLFDVLGRMIVTDRRIVWSAPITGRLYREVGSETILDADLIENSGRSGWVALRIGQADDWVEMDLHGVPQAEEAVAAIRLSCCRARS